MCAKLKCCLNYEVDSYVEASRRFPPRNIVLQTMDSDYFFFKSDILAGLVTYSTDKNSAANLETITASRAREVVEMNKRGEKPLSLSDDNVQNATKPSVDLLAGADVSRFDKAKKKKNKPRGQRRTDAENRKRDTDKKPKE